MRVKVTQDHIDRGLRSHTRCCPLALALQSATGNIYICVGSSLVWDTNKPGEIYGHISTRAEHFVEDFDNGEPVVPFEFELEMK